MLYILSIDGRWKV